MACASALTVRWAAVVVRRLAIAARARASSSGLPEIEQVHRVDEDVEVLAPELQHPVGHQRARARGHRPRAIQCAGLRHGGRRRARLHLEAGIDDGASQVGRDLLVRARLHDERDVRVVPVPGQAPALRQIARAARKTRRTASSTVSG